MAYTIVRHKVNDFAVWKKVFDDFESTRKSNGERSAVVLQTDGDPNEVTVINTWDSVAGAKTFIESSVMREAMGNAGVASAPEIYFGNEA